MNPNDLWSVALPLQTTFVLPRGVARAVLQVGDKLVKLDSNTGIYVRNEPTATAIAMAVFDDDAAKASAFLDAFLIDYNAYAEAALQSPGATPFFVP